MRVKSSLAIAFCLIELGQKIEQSIALISGLGGKSTTFMIRFILGARIKALAHECIGN
jgi:hypothetical protein